MAVYLDRPPRQAFLLAWGRAPDAWWGYCRFRQRVRTGDQVDEQPVAAWLPAASIRQTGWYKPVDLPRLKLGHDRTEWPAPSGWPSWYARAWPQGPLTLPPGCVINDGPAWRQGRA